MALAVASGTAVIARGACIHTLSFSQMGFLICGGLLFCPLLRLSSFAFCRAMITTTATKWNETPFPPSLFINRWDVRAGCVSIVEVRRGLQMVRAPFFFFPTLLPWRLLLLHKKKKKKKKKRATHCVSPREREREREREKQVVASLVRRKWRIEENIHLLLV